MYSICFSISIRLSVEELANLCILLKIHINDATKDRSFLQEVLLVHFERRTFQKQLINSMPLYPSEVFFIFNLFSNFSECFLTKT